MAEGGTKTSILGEYLYTHDTGFLWDMYWCETITRHRILDISPDVVVVQERSAWKHRFLGEDAWTPWKSPAYEERARVIVDRSALEHERRAVTFECVLSEFCECDPEDERSCRHIQSECFYAREEDLLEISRSIRASESPMPSHIESPAGHISPHRRDADDDSRDVASARVIAIGAPYDTAIQCWPETEHFNYNPEERLSQLTLFVLSPSEEDIATFRYSPIQLGVAVIDGLAFIAYECGFKLGGTPYSWHLALTACHSPETVPLPDVPMKGWPVIVILVDASTGLVVAFRHTALSLRVSRALVRAIHEQAAHPFDEAIYRQRVAEVYARISLAELRQHAVMDVDNNS